MSARGMIVRGRPRVSDDIRELRAFFGWSASEEELLAQRQQFFDEACRNAKLELMPGVEHVVRELHMRGLKLAVTSAAVRTSIEWILERVGLRDLFTLIVDGGDVERGKPDPESYLLTARKLGVAPHVRRVRRLARRRDRGEGGGHVLHRGAQSERDCSPGPVRC